MRLTASLLGWQSTGVSPRPIELSSPTSSDQVLVTEGLSKPQQQAVWDALAVRDPEAPVDHRRQGQAEPDPDLRDNENVPLPTVPVGFEADPSCPAGHARVPHGHRRLHAAEVLPYVPDAWVDHDKTRIGYEIPLTRHFYVYVPPRPLEEIDAEINSWRRRSRRCSRGTECDGCPGEADGAVEDQRLRAPLTRYFDHWTVTAVTPRIDEDIKCLEVEFETSGEVSRRSHSPSDYAYTSRSKRHGKADGLSIYRDLGVQLLRLALSITQQDSEDCATYKRIPPGDVVVANDDSMSGIERDPAKRSISDTYWFVQYRSSQSIVHDAHLLRSVPGWSTASSSGSSASSKASRLGRPC